MLMIFIQTESTKIDNAFVFYNTIIQRSSEIDINKLSLGSFNTNYL